MAPPWLLLPSSAFLLLLLLTIATLHTPPAFAACAPYALYTASSGTLGTVPGPYAATQTCAFSIRSDISALATANPGATIYTTVAYTSFNLGCMRDFLFVYLYGPNGQMLSSYTGDAVPVVHWFTYTDILLVLHTESAGVANGFTANYTIALCPNNCGGVGTCTRGVCTCPPTHKGDGCETLLCPNACSGHGSCVTANARGCVCTAGYKGSDCGVPSTVPMWQMDILPGASGPRASAKGAYSPTHDAYFMFGGITYNSAVDGNELDAFMFGQKAWAPLNNLVAPPPRSGHAAVAVEDSFYVIGGTVNGIPDPSLFEFQINITTWITYQIGVFGTPGLALHAAAFVPSTRQIFIVGGETDALDWMGLVWRFHVDTKQVTTFATTNAPVGFMAHSMVYDAIGNRLIVAGGMVKDTSSSAPAFARVIYVLSPATGNWHTLTPAATSGTTLLRLPRDFQASALIGDYLVFYGGRTSDDNVGRSACYSPSIYAYNLWCNTWSEITQSLSSVTTPRGRIASDLFVRDNLLYSVGGFVGYPLNEFMVLQHDRCAWYTLAATCTNNSMCTWSNSTGCSESATTQPAAYPAVGATRRVTTLPFTANATTGNPCGVCEMMTTQPECDGTLAASASCLWCPYNGTCLTLAPAGIPASAPQLAQCQRNSTCFATYSANATGSACRACSRDQSGLCRWCGGEQACVSSGGDGVCDSQSAACPSATCGAHTNCSDCVNSRCAWCDGNRQCVSRTTATCTDLTVPALSCPAATTQCSALASCSACTAQSTCAWCHDPPQCVPYELFPLHFGLAQCRTYSYGAGATCLAGASLCAAQTTCGACVSQSFCGWCGATATCIYGTWEAPLSSTATCPNITSWTTTLTPNYCVGAPSSPPTVGPTAPPLCLPCNGHSLTCDAATGRSCTNCTDDTRNGDAKRCELCASGFVGSGQAGSNCWFILQTNVDVLRPVTLAAGKTRYMQTSGQVDSSYSIVFVRLSGSPVLYVSATQLLPSANNSDFNITASTDFSGRPLPPTATPKVYFFAVHASGSDASYTVGLTTTSLAAPSSGDSTATVWVFVSAMLLVIAVFLGLFVIQVRRFRRGRAMMRPAPVVFEVDKTARSVWLKVVPGTNDNARMRSIVESENVGVNVLKGTPYTAVTVLVQLPYKRPDTTNGSPAPAPAAAADPAEAVDLGSLWLGHVLTVKDGVAIPPQFRDALDADDDTAKPAAATAVAAAAATETGLRARWRRHVWRPQQHLFEQFPSDELEMDDVGMPSIVGAGGTA